jgi:hypothetical protein
LSFIDLLIFELTYRLINDENSQDKSLLSKDTNSNEAEGKLLNKLGKCRSKPSKTDSSIDCGADADGDPHVQGAPSAREEKVSSMKTVSLIWNHQIYFSLI